VSESDSTRRPTTARARADRARLERRAQRLSRVIARIGLEAMRRARSLERRVQDSANGEGGLSSPSAMPFACSDASIGLSGAVPASARSRSSRT
jgi:hypothetical protein